MVDPMEHMESIRAIAYKIAWDSESFQTVKDEMCLAMLECPDDTPIPLLFLRAKNKAKDFLSSKKYQYSWGGKIPHVSISGMPNSEGIPAEDLQDYVDVALDVEYLLSRLGEPEKVAIQLYLDGYKQREIAEFLEIDRTTVSKRISAGIQRLRKYVLQDKDSYS